MRAVVDIGSNSIKYTLETERSNASSRSSESQVIALGKNLKKGSPLSPQALERLDQALRKFAKNLAPAKGQIMVVGTAALRHCSNPEAAAKLVEHHLDTRLNIISGSREAELSFLGAMQDSPFKNPLCVDVGGASTEVGLARQGGPRHSVPWGALRAHESLLHGQCPVTPLVFKSASQTLHEAFQKELKAPLASIDSGTIDGILAIGGSLMMTAKSLYPDQATHKTVHASLRELKTFNDEVSKLDLAQRISKLGFSADRAEIGCAGMMCLFAAVDIARNVDKVLVTEGGLRAGVFLAWNDFDLAKTQDG